MVLMCDEMLLGLCRWLRAAGHDTAMAARGADDRLVVEQAVREGRLLLTRDSRILQRRLAARRTLLLHGDRLEGWAAQATAALAVDWLKAPFSRCLVCNEAIEPAPAAVAAGVPISSAARESAAVTWCPACRRTYWPGSHVRRMRARLERWKAGDFTPMPSGPTS